MTFALLLLIFNCCLQKVLAQPALPADLKEFHVQFFCTIYKDNKSVHNFPGDFCVFQEDGSFISGTHSGLRKIRIDDSIEWEIKKHIHHQVNLSPDKNRILTLSSKFDKKTGKTIREDIFLILNQKGEVLHQQSGTWLLAKAGLKSIDWPVLHNFGEEKADIELTHFNSIYEIPENAGAKQTSYLAPGNIILNSSVLGIFILTPDLSKLLYHSGMKESGIYLIHDVQVTPEGEFIFFNNVVMGDEKSNNPYSSVDKFNPVTKKTTFRFTAEPKGMFYSTLCGGVQELGDYIFFSHMVTGGYFYSKTSKTIVKTVPPGNSTPLKMTPVQQIKLVDVRKFLKHRGK